MSAFSERVRQDILKIEELSKLTSGRVRIKKKTGNPPNKIILELNYPTAPSSSYPDKIQKKTEVRIELLSRYPFQEPLASITTPIFHPNVYSSGKICLGTKWMPTQGLDLLIKKIIQIITFDEAILNEQSPANNSALSWYRTAAKKNPNSFPTDKLIVQETPKKKISWSNVDKEPNKAVISCPNCNSSLRVPTGKKLEITCPKCTNKFFREL